MAIKFPVVASVSLAMLSPAAAAVGSTPSRAAADHLALNVADIQVSIGFYQHVFGFDEIPAPGLAARWLDLGGGMALHLIGGRTQPFTPVKSVHLALKTRDLAPVMVALRRRQVRWKRLGRHGRRCDQRSRRWRPPDLLPGSGRLLAGGE